MSSISKAKITIRPFVTQKGRKSLLYCTTIGVLFLAFGIFISTIAPSNDKTANSMKLVFGIISVIIFILGFILYLIFPKTIITFDKNKREASIKNGKNNNVILAFSSLQPFEINEILRGYSHQYFCSNKSFGIYSDLFFGSNSKIILRRAKELVNITESSLYNYDGKKIM
jgi:hypothetical protein